MNKWLKRLIALAVLIAAVVAARWWLLAADPVEVEAVTVGRGRVESTITNSKAGTVRARRRALISPEASGRVLSVNFREGDSVEEGAVLFQLNDSSQRAQLDLAERALESAQAQSERACIAADLAESELRRGRKLADNAVISDDEIESLQSRSAEAQAACRAAQAEARKARAAVGLAQAELEKTRALAPFAGVVADLDLEVGEWVTPSPPLLQVPAALDLLDPTSLYVSAPMDEVDAGKIRAGQRVKITVDSHRGQEFAGEIVRVADYVLDVEAQNRTVEVEAEFEDAHVVTELLPGTSADLELILEVREDVLRIPTPAIFEGGKVFVVRGGVLEERGVALGIRNWDWCEVLTGLTAGDRVVSALDRKEIQAGAEVTVRESQPEP